VQQNQPKQTTKAKSNNESKKQTKQSKAKHSTSMQRKAKQSATKAQQGTANFSNEAKQGKTKRSNVLGVFLKLPPQKLY
jgi:hypothetical protein